MTEPVASYGGLSWWGNFAEYGFLTRLRAEQLRDVGATLSPFNAFLLLQGLETLPSGWRPTSPNARIVAEFLEATRRELGGYAGLARHPWTTSGRSATCPAAWSRLLLRRRRRARGRASGSSSGSSCAATSPTSATPRLVIHPGSTTHEQLDDDALGAGVSARPDAHLGRHRGPGGHLLRSRPGADRRDDVSGHDDDDADRDASARARAPRDHPPRRHGGDGGDVDRPVEASYFVATYLLSSTRFDACTSSTPRPVSEILGRHVYPSLEALPGDARPRRRVPPSRRPPRVADEAIAVGAQTLWFQLGLRHDERAAAGPRRRASPSCRTAA